MIIPIWKLFLHTSHVYFIVYFLSFMKSRYHPNDFFSQDSQVRVSKLPKLGLSRLWAKLCKQTSNGDEVWSKVVALVKIFLRIAKELGQFPTLMVESQIGNLIPSLFLGHNLCFRCPNEQCKPILDIYVPRAFRWYEEQFKTFSFDPCNCPLKIQ
jgi:hypothetical protein